MIEQKVTRSVASQRSVPLATSPESMESRLRELLEGLDTAARVLDQVRNDYEHMLVAARPLEIGPKFEISLVEAPTRQGEPPKRPGLRVTPRQAQILELVAAGLPDKDIARRLGISHCTLRTHLDRFFRLNGIHDRAGAAARWVRSSPGPAAASAPHPGPLPEGERGLAPS